MSSDNPSDPRALHNIVVKDTAYFDKFASETNGEVTRVKIVLQPHGGNPLHYHQSFVENFECTKGKLGLEVGAGNIIYLDPGKTASVPKRTLHRFLNDTEESVEFRITVEPGNEGFEKSLYIAYGLANDGMTDNQGVPKNFLEMCTFTVLGDIHVAGWTGSVMNPLIKAAYAYARWSGVEQRLIDKYVPAR